MKINWRELIGEIDGFLRQILMFILLIVAGMVLLRLAGVTSPWLRVPGADNGQNMGILLAALAWVFRSGR